jgi:hypothetical protein
MELLILSNRRKYFEAELEKDGYQYDIWIDYTNLEE